MRAELILLGSTKLAQFEQLQLKNLVSAAIDEAMAGLVRSAAPWLARVPRWLHAEERARVFATRVARRLVWSRLVRVHLPTTACGAATTCHRRRRGPYPGPLSDLRNVELAPLFAQIERGRRSRAIDWSDLTDRMRYLICLFRRQQRNVELFEMPPCDDTAPES